MDHTEVYPQCWDFLVSNTAPFSIGRLPMTVLVCNYSSFVFKQCIDYLRRLLDS